MTPLVDGQQWWTKEEAAAILGCSTRAIERRAAAGEIDSREMARHGKRPATVYLAADVERLRSEMDTTGRGPSELAAVTRPGVLVNGAAVVESTSLGALATIAASLRGGVAMAAPRRWCTLAEAAADSRLSARFLRQLCRRGEVVHVWDEGQYKIASDSLAAWQPSGAAAARVRPPKVPPPATSSAE